MINDNKFDNEELIIEIVKEELENSTAQSVAHHWDHIDRVYRRAIAIAVKINDEKIDMEILRISALLHDISQKYYNKENHVKKSINKASDILKKIKYPEDKTKKVLEVISQHSTEDNNRPTSIESKILFDADKLDGIGAIGIARVFSFCGQNGLTPQKAIEWYKRKIDIALSSVQTEIGKKILEKKLKYVFDFIDKFYDEEANVI